MFFVIKPITNPNSRAIYSAAILSQAATTDILPQAVSNAPIPPINIPTVPSQPNKDFLAKLKPYTDNNKKSYAQASKLNMEDIIHIKDIFSSLPLKKIIEVNDLLSKLKLIKP